MAFFLQTNAPMPTDTRLAVPHEIYRTILKGPKRSPGLRRRSQLSKNCTNAKKDMKDAIKRRRKHEVEVAYPKEKISYLYEQLMLKRERGLVVSQNTQGVAFDIVRGYFDRLNRGFDSVRYPRQAQEMEIYLRATFANDLKSPDFTGLDVFLK